MILNLVMIKDSFGKKEYFAVNDKHYDAMLACGGTSLDYTHSWEYLGDIEISGVILEEEGYKYEQN